MKYNSNNINLLSVYAPREERGRENQMEVEKLYDKMEQTIQTTNNRDFLVKTRYFNAQIGKRTADCEGVIENYSKEDKRVKMAENLQKGVNVTT